MTKYLAALVVVIIASVVILKPIVMHENEYKVVVVNMSEYKISHVEITGPGTASRKMKAIKQGHIQDYIFIPEADGTLEYTITQNSQTLNGVIHDNLKKGETGDIYVVLGEMYQVNIHDEFDI